VKSAARASVLAELRTKQPTRDPVGPLSRIHVHTFDGEGERCERQKVIVDNTL